MLIGKTIKFLALAAAVLALCGGCEERYESKDGQRIIETESNTATEPLSFGSSYFAGLSTCESIILDKVSGDPMAETRSAYLTSEEVGSVLSCLQTAELSSSDRLSAESKYNLMFYDSGKMWLGTVHSSNGYIWCDEGEIISDELTDLLEQLKSRCFLENEG